MLTMFDYLNIYSMYYMQRSTWYLQTCYTLYTSWYSLTRTGYSQGAQVFSKQRPCVVVLNIWYHHHPSRKGYRKQIVSNFRMTARWLVFIMRYNWIIHNIVAGAGFMCESPACSNKALFLQRMLIAVRFIRFAIISNLAPSFPIRRSFFMSSSILHRPYHSHEVQLKYDIFQGDRTKSISHTITFKNDILQTTFEKIKSTHLPAWIPSTLFPPTAEGDELLGAFFFLL